MASSKRLGFFWGEEKISVVEFEKNTPVQVVSAPLGARSNTSSPFSSSLTEEIQITAILQKMLKDNHISGGSFYVSLPMKDIILRSFIIPFLKPDVIQDAIKFEAKKYMPFDIQDLAFVYHTIPFLEGQTKRLQVIFFAVRKEVLARYGRIFKQVNAEVSYGEPYMVSLTKALLFRKEIKSGDHLAFLILDKNSGRICFIDKGIPQFIREFSISSTPQAEAQDPTETLNSKIVDEVGNSFDFYARQFSGDRIEQMMVASDFIQGDLISLLETELKIKLTKFSPTITTAKHGQSNDMDAIYAMGACVNPPMDSLSGFNFLKENKSKPFLQSSSLESLVVYKEILYVFIACLLVLAGAYFFYQMQLKATQKQCDQLTAQEGAFLNQPLGSINDETLANSAKLLAFKDIRMKSDMTYIILRVASHLPQGVLLNDLNIKYEQSDSVNAHVTIDMTGDVFRDDPDEQIAVVNKVFSSFRYDKDLSRFITSVNLDSLKREEFKGQQVTGFTIRCS